MSAPIMDTLKQKFADIVRENALTDENISIKLGTLTTKQAIGDPSRKDYALLEGREVMIEARFRDGYGQAFTDSPADFEGTLVDILKLPLDSNHARALFIASFNAVMASLGTVTATRHCKDEEPETCAREIADYLMANYGQNRIGQIGLQPAILENLTRVFGKENVSCTDLAVKNIGADKFGVEIWDGRTRTDELIEHSDIILATSSTIINDSYDHIARVCADTGKRLIIFGISGASAAAVGNLERLCFQGH